MPNNSKDYIIDIEIKDLIEETDAASKRTRWIIIVLIVATVIIGIGFYNSTTWSFSVERLESLKKFENTPTNNLYDKNKPLLDSYFGENDFRDTVFFHGIAGYFKKNEFKGLQRLLCEKIYGVSDSKTEAVAQYLYDNFSPETRNIIIKDCADYTLLKKKVIKEFLTPKEFKDLNDLKLLKNENKFKYLASDLNRILHDKNLYNKERFNGIDIKNEETRQLLIARFEVSELPFKMDASISKAKPEDVDIIRLNRLLLEAAFPDEILPSADIIPQSESLRTKELAKYIAFDDKVQFVEIPFFGNAIDVNDLGAAGGISLIIVLLLFRFSLSREIKNLNLSFKQAFYRGKLDKFYHSLAMRQVLTVPEMAGETKNQTLSVGTKYVCLLPLLVIFLGVSYDYYSSLVLGVFQISVVLTHTVVETGCFFVILYLSLRCVERQTHIDDIWEDYSKIMKHYEKNSCSLKYSTVIIEQPKVLIQKTLANFCDLKDKEIIRIINYRINDGSKESRFANSESYFVRWLGKFWIARLMTHENLARLIPSQWLADWVRDNTFGQVFLMFSFVGLFFAAIFVYFYTPIFFAVLPDTHKAVIENIAISMALFGVVGFSAQLIFELRMAYQRKRESEDKKKKTEIEAADKKTWVEDVQNKRNAEQKKSIETAPSNSALPESQEDKAPEQNSQEELIELRKKESIVPKIIVKKEDKK